MTFKIYGLRANGEMEVRYIGQTSKTPESRIERETAQARSRIGRYAPQHIEPLHAWLLANEVEGVVLATAADRAEANAKEREFAVAFAKIGHRLFNRWLIPAEYRIEWRAEGYGKRAAEMRRRRQAA